MTHRASESGRILFRLFLFLLFIGALGVGMAVYLFNVPFQGFSNSITLDFPKGTSTQAMANELEHAGVVRYNWEFILVRALHPHSRLQAGEYQFTHADTPWNVFDRILRGDVFFYEVTIPEGANIFDIAASVSQFDFIPDGDFLKAARNPALIHDLAPQAVTLEGYLFPSTYRITRRTTAQQLCQMMTDLFRKNWREIQTPDHPIPIHEAVTLASLVEKETGVREERPIVASVFRNRLQMGMPLDCDPTTIYAALLEQRYHGTIYRSDLNSVNRYNTYQHTGLPPGPIANPGAASLKAAVAPATTEYIFFVAKADGSGGHHFSKSIDEHNRAVEEYRRRTSKTPARTHAANIKP